MSETKPVISPLAPLQALRDQWRELFQDISDQSDKHVCSLDIAEQDGDPMCADCTALYDRGLALLRAWPEPQEAAWVLIETAPKEKGGRVETCGIALSSKDARDFVSRNDEFGYSRTSLPYRIYNPPAFVPPSEEPKP